MSQLFSGISFSQDKVISENFSYDPTGRRDPFKSFLLQKIEIQAIAITKDVKKDEIPYYLKSSGIDGEGLEGADVDKFKLVGVMWEVSDPKAMVRAPSGKVYMVRRETRIGKMNGYVASIREGEIVVIELNPRTHFPYTKVLTLQK
jgi:type IV pilus assembly protein PilP